MNPTEMQAPELSRVIGGARPGEHRVCPSLLSADFARLADELAKVEAAGGDWHHVDVMDGHFVPNLTLGPPVVEKIHAVAKLPLDVHLMITEPRRYAEAFVQAGATVLTFHVEVCADATELRETVQHFRRVGVPHVGVALNPDTPVEAVEPVLGEVDLVLAMSVFPGFGGQAFHPEVLPKVAALRALGYDGWLEMDGGLDETTVPQCAAAGADALVAGSALFGSSDMQASIRSFRALAAQARAGRG